MQRLGVRISPGPIFFKEKLMNDYMLIIKIPLKALDDIEAREKAKVIIQNKNISDESDVKLQEVFKNQSPRKVVL